MHRVHLLNFSVVVNFLVWLLTWLKTALFAVLRFTGWLQPESQVGLDILVQPINWLLQYLRLDVMVERDLNHKVFAGLNCNLDSTSSFTFNCEPNISVVGQSNILVVVKLTLLSETSNNFKDVVGYQCMCYPFTFLVTVRAPLITAVTTPKLYFWP